MTKFGNTSLKFLLYLWKCFSDLQITMNTLLGYDCVLNQIHKEQKLN